MNHQILQPEGWPRPKGYSNGIAATGRHIFTAGVVGWNVNEEFVSDSIVDQFRQTLINTVAILKEGGAAPSDIVRMTCYVTNKRDYLDHVREIGAVWREVLGKVFPAMAVVQVVALMEDAAKVEIETTAVIAQ
ncbi:RidA/YER057c/UK114 superfamily protein [hydrothermal vent metagenome]|uniref:RidA/YER057c/UK114 superfamily protein n=1 Tax=hydrothermal vent metagenome TaxID=652676 RepID=A0A3B0SB04_9ZZZZ